MLILYSIVALVVERPLSKFLRCRSLKSAISDNFSCIKFFSFLALRSFSLSRIITNLTSLQNSIGKGSKVVGCAFPLFRKMSKIIIKCKTHKVLNKKIPQYLCTTRLFEHNKREDKFHTNQGFFSVLSCISFYYVNLPLSKICL